MDITETGKRMNRLAGFGRFRGRFLTFNTVVRVNQIEVARDRNEGNDESTIHTPAAAEAFRAAIAEGWPGAPITWSFSWCALHSDAPNYREIRALVKRYATEFGDDVTFIPGAYFANMYNTREQVNLDLRDGLNDIRRFMGDGFRPKSVIAGFLAAENQRYLAEVEGIHVCQGNIWSQFAIDNGDGDGSISYPYYPSREHFCKPAQGPDDFIDCVNLDGWTMDFLAARRQGFADGFNSRMGVGPIETLGKYGADVGLQQMLATTAVHFDRGVELNGFGWVNNIWELSIVSCIGHLASLTEWLRQIRVRWPDAQLVTQGDFGNWWRQAFSSNDFIDYRFEQTGTGIGGSDADKRIRWFMNKEFRLALLSELSRPASEVVIDFSHYGQPAQEPQDLARNWTLYGDINQKQTRPQDLPVPLERLSKRDQAMITARYPRIQCPLD